MVDIQGEAVGLEESVPRGRKAKAEAIRSAIRHWWRWSTDREIANQLGVSPTSVGKHRRELEEAGEILPRLESGQLIEACLREVSIFAIEPSVENDSLYEPVRIDDPAFQKFLLDIKENGILEPIVVSADGFIISGHRRHAAAKHLGLKRLPIRIRPDVSRLKDRDTFAKLLASHNSQRVKTTAEVVREGVATMGEDCWQSVRKYRRDSSEIGGVQVVELVGSKRRSSIVQKTSLREAIKATVYGNRRDWPLSDRRIFYLLLNVEGLLRNDVRGTPFANTPDCYDDLTNMVTRMRLDATIPFDCITDETRPVVRWDTHRSVGPFIDRELEDLFSGYWRDLLQSQPNHVEVLCEKNTVAVLLREISGKYTIPMTSGRGYSSLPPRKDMVDRFRAGGREKLIVIVVADFDPEGTDIPNAFGLSLRDDFGLDPDELVIVKAALTDEQVRSMDLHEGQLAKEAGSRYTRFLELYGPRCWELEAVPADTLRHVVEESIRGVLDIDAFEDELRIEELEQMNLNEHRQVVRCALAGLDLN